VVDPDVRRALLATSLALMLLPATAHAVKRPHGWPYKSVQLGLIDKPGDAAALRHSAPFGFRYQYLSGGANTALGWATYNANGTYVSRFAAESFRNRMTPVFSYYMLRQSLPGRAITDEKQADLTNLSDAATMRALFQDLELFFRRANQSHRTEILQVEPDMWGFAQAALGDDAANVPAKVAATGLPELAGLPDNLAGFAQAVVRLRNQRAPHVLLGYHLSVWGTGVDVQYADPPLTDIDPLAARSVAFYNSLHAPFDVTFAEVSDRDAGFKQIIEGDSGRSWWNAGDFQRNVRYLGDYSRATGQAIVMWQIPLGNTVMRAENNTFGHFQDNRVQYWLDGSRTHLRQYLAAGVIAYLFGGGADGTTCACDARHDGVTNPRPIDGNNRRSLSADDDGGFFKSLARRFYKQKPLKLR
jgi:hypothetical protein